MPTELEQKLAVVKSPDIEQFELQQRMARLFVASKLFSDVKGVSETEAIAQAFTKIALGASMGFSAAESMTGIDIVQGRIAVSAQLRAARMQRAGFEWDVLQLDDQGCRLLLKKNGAPIVTTVIDGDGTQIEVAAIVSFTADDAKRAGLAGKDNYQRYKPDMFFARAITRAQRWYAPGVLSLDVMSTEEVLSEPGLSGEQKIHTQALRSKQKEEAMKKEYHAPILGSAVRPGSGTEEPPPTPIKVKPKPAEEPVPQESENFDAEPTEAPSSRVESVRSAQAKLEQKRREKAEQGPNHVSEIKTEW
jgi:hypothetical protein